MTTIEWTQRPGTKGETWNPFAAFDKETGKRGWICLKVSPGCENCYAQGFNVFRGNGHPYKAGEFDKVEIRLVNLDQPLRWRKPRTVFVCSMTDLFFDGYTDRQIDQVFAAMALAPQHTFQVLTKRAERMRRYLSDPETPRRIAARMILADDSKQTLEVISSEVLWSMPAAGPSIPDGLSHWPLPNIWAGTSVEDQRRADQRIPHLLATPAVVRFLSCEPLLADVDLRPYLALLDVRCCSRCGYRTNFAVHGPCPNDGETLGPDIRVDWVIAGGESGPGARPCHIDWVRDIAAQCRNAQVSTFVKQLGAQPVYGRGPERLWLNDAKGGDIEEWPGYLRVREWPIVEATV